MTSQFGSGATPDAPAPPTRPGGQRSVHPHIAGPPDDIQIIPDQVPAPPSPAPPPVLLPGLIPPGIAEEVSGWSRKRKRKWGISLGLLTLIVLAGLVSVWLTVQQAIDDAETVTIETIAAVNQGEPIGEFYVQSSDCSGTPPNSGTPVDVGWTIERIGYSLSFGDGATSWDFSNNLSDEGLEFVDDYAQTRPPGADFAFVRGLFTESGESLTAQFFLIRMPGEDWRICAVQSVE